MSLNEYFTLRAQAKTQHFAPGPRDREVSMSDKNGRGRRCVIYFLHNFHCIARISKVRVDYCSSEASEPNSNVKRHIQSDRNVRHRIKVEESTAAPVEFDRRCGARRGKIVEITTDAGPKPPAWHET